MTTLINADTVVGGAVITGDASGNLALQSGGVTGLTVSSGGTVTFAGTVTGIPGGGGATATGSVVLTSASLAAQSITTTNYGQSITLPDATTVGKGSSLYNINNLGAYPLKILNSAGSILGFVYSNCPVTVGLADNSTAAGTWSLVGAEPYAITAALLSTTLFNFTSIDTSTRIVLDADRTFLLLGLSSSINMYGVIYNSSTLTWGTPTLIRTATISFSKAILSATNQILVCSSDTTTGFEAVVLTISGTSITVGTAATATLSSTAANNPIRLVAVGSSFVLLYNLSLPAVQIRAFTISGTTVTIGTATVLTGTSIAYNYLLTISSSVVLTLTVTAATAVYATPYSISGTTITLGTQANYATNAGNNLRVQPINSTRLAVIVPATGATNIAGLIISVSGTTASISSGTAVTGGTTTNAGMIVSGSKAIIYSNTGGVVNIMTDTAGTANFGTSIVAASGISNPISANATTNQAIFYTPNHRTVIDFSGSSPTLVAIDRFGATVPSNSVSDYDSALSSVVLKGTTSYLYSNSTAGAYAVAISENAANVFMTTTCENYGAVLNGADNEKWFLSDTSVYGLLRRFESIS
jgi:hypothetical protein